MVPDFLYKKGSTGLVSPISLLCLLFPRKMERICDIVCDTFQVRKNLFFNLSLFRQFAVMMATIRGVVCSEGMCSDVFIFRGNQLEQELQNSYERIGRHHGRFSFRKIRVWSVSS